MDSYNPIKPYEWDWYDILFLQVPIPDFCHVPLEKIQTCVEYIHWNIINKRSLYLNCRVGVCRSALILACYFIKYLKMTSEQAFLYIKSKRIQVQNGHRLTLELFEALQI